MPRAKNGRVQPDRKALDVEIARLRDLDVGALRARWHTVFGRRPPPHLPRHLLFRILAYRLQGDHLGDLDPESQRTDLRKRGFVTKVRTLKSGERVGGIPNRVGGSMSLLALTLCLRRQSSPLFMTY